MTDVQGDTPHTNQGSNATALARELAAARDAGGWLGWAGILLGVAWLIAATTLFFMMGSARLLGATEAPHIAIMGVVIAMPALFFILSGFLARSNRRAASANAIVLEAAARLLDPAQTAANEATTLADQMRSSAQDVDRSIAHAISAMKAMSGEIGDERQRLEQVSYAAADNARDLTERLNGERAALESLVRDLKGQMDSMNEAIPRQAEMMVAAARMAGEEVAKADTALEGRLAAMTQARDALTLKLTELDTIAAAAASRTEDVTFAVTRVEQKLDESRRTVDSAVRAGEMAAAAATSTGDALKDAVSSALDSARSANTEINARTREASETAARDIAELRMASEQAVQAVRAAGNAARAETDMVEKRLTKMASAMRTAVISTEEAIKADAPRINGRANGISEDIEQVTPNLQDTTPLSVSQPDDIAPDIPVRLQADRLSPSRMNILEAPDESVDADIFDAGAESDRVSGLKTPAAPAPSIAVQSEAPLELGRDIDPADQDPLTLRRRHDDVPKDIPPNASDIFDDAPVRAVNGVSTTHESVNLPTPTPARNETAWADMLADIDRSDAPARDREETATALIEHLEETGIRLPDSFRPKDKKRIAGAARKGERQRRETTKNVTSRQVERVAARLKNDRDLMLLARDFVSMEAADALVALEQTAKTNRNASSRLAAYLLVDAVLNG